MTLTLEDKKDVVVAAEDAVLKAEVALAEARDARTVAYKELVAEYEKPKKRSHRRKEESK